MSSIDSRFVVPLGRALLSVSLLSGCALTRKKPYVHTDASAQSATAIDTSRALVLLPGLSERSVLRAPSVAIDGSTVFVAANLFSGDSVVGPSLYLGRLRRTATGALLPLDRLELPPGEFQFAFPRVVAGGGRLHLVWCELASRWRTNAEWETPVNRSQSLWHSVLEHGVWSLPTRISTATQFGWDAKNGGVALERSGALHAVVWREIDGEAIRVIDFRWSGNGWHDVTLPYRPGLMRSTAVATRGDTVIVALVETREDTSRVVVAASPGADASWTAPLIVPSRAMREASVTRLALAAAGDELLLAIGEQPDRRSSLDRLRVFRVTGDLHTTNETTVDLPPTVAGFDLAAGPCGAGVLLLNTFSTEPRLYTAAITRDASTPVIARLLPWTRAVFSSMAATQDAAIAAFVYFPVASRYWNVATVIPMCPP